MPAFPITASTGDPVFRGLSSSVDSVRRFSRMASDSAVKLNTQERIVSPGEDSLAFSSSRSLRGQLSSLRAVQESGQLNITTLNLAIEGLESIRGQLDGIKRLVVQAQTANVDDRDSMQAEIDLALKQIDSTASSTKVGGRTLLDGSTSIKAVKSIQANGTKTQFSVYANANSFGSVGVDGIREVRVNKIGAHGPIRALNDGTRVLSINVSMNIANKATKGTLQLAAGAAASYSDFRVTGKLGSATIRISSNALTLAQLGGVANAFNQLASETGVTLMTSGGNTFLTSVGMGADDFVKVEFLGGGDADGNNVLDGATFGNVGGAGPVGEAQVVSGQAAVAVINGTSVTLGGEFGTTARFLENGYDIEIDFMSNALLSTTNRFSQVNAEIGGGIGGLLGANGTSGDSTRYGIGNFTTESLGRGNAINSSNTGIGTLGTTGSNLQGNRVLANNSVANLGSGGALALESGRLNEAIQTIDRAVKQVVKEQARLGVIQSSFMDSVGRAEVTQGNVSAADADVLGVDAAAEITTLVQSQVGVSTATALSSQITGIQQTVLSLLRG